MSSDWRTVRLSEVASEVTVGFVGTMANEYVDSGIPFLRSLNVGRLKIDTYDIRYISHDFHSRISKSRLRPGDVVIVRTGKPGTCAVIPEELPDSNCSDLVIVRCGAEILNRFLCYYVNSAASNHIAAHTVGAVQQHFNVASAKTMEIPLPPLGEQKAIAHILGTLDDKIELNRKTNETLEAMAKALFKSWFVDFDPVRAKAEGRPTGLPAEVSDLFPDSFEDSELGEIPSGWEPRTIREWGRTECGKTPSTNNQEFYGNDYMFVTIPDLHNGFHIISSGKQLSELGADSQRKKLLPSGSVMVSCIATPGLVGVAKEACFTNQQINSIIPNKMEASWFLALAMIENRDLLLSLGGGGSVFFNLSKGRFDEIEILAPSEDLISAFSGVVSDLMDRCFATKQEIIALTNIRDALLPKLISGEIRIPNAEKMLEEVGI